MSGEEYRALRERVGSQREAAERLGVHRQTISQRERGVLPVDREAELALRCLAEHARKR